MFLLLTILWFIWEIKYILFWLYLWQLKEYHIGRFLDHFNTHKGKKLVFSFEQIFKFVILVFLIFVPENIQSFLISITIIVYLIEFAFFIKGIITKSFKKPVFTLKSSFLTFVCLLVILLQTILIYPIYSVTGIQSLLMLDLLTVFIVSFIVLLFQPLFVSWRNVILAKAKHKLEKIKELNNIIVIAITGSYGKTSTKEFLATILSYKYNVLKTKEHQNSEIGIANSILKDLKPSYKFFIAEVGAYNRGKIEEVCSIIKPKIGIITGVNEQHLSLFGSMKNLLSAEGGEELAKSLPKDGLLIVNGENKYCLSLYKKAINPVDGKKKIYCRNNKKVNSDIWAENIEIYKNNISFIAITKDGQMEHFDVKILGSHNIQNLLGAILTAKELGMNLQEISEACKQIKQEQGGMALIRGKYGLEIIDSSYSANPDGVLADLEYLSVFPKKKIIIMPCLIELGKKSAEIHENIGKKIAEVCDLAIITSKDRFNNIKKGAVEAGMNEKDILLCDKIEDIYSVITLFCKSGDAVLLEGRVPNELIKMLTE